jgi:hypothetical protein
MLEPIVVSRSALERHLKKVIPIFGEVLSTIKVYSDGDGHLPKIREAMRRTNIVDWAKHYQDPTNALKTYLLMVMSPDEINKLNQDVLAMSSAEQASFLDDIIKEVTDGLDEDDDQAPEELDPERAAQFWYFAMPTVYNFLAYVAHRKSIYQLVAEAMAGDDDSYLKAIQVDKSTLTHIPYFVERNRRAADEGDINFLRQIATYRQKPILRTQTRLLPLVMLLSYLYQMNMLDQLCEDMEWLLGLCEQTGIYGDGQGAADLESFKKTIRRFKNEQQIAFPRSEQKIIVKDMDSSKSCP